MWRLYPLPRLAVRRRIASARLDADGQAHFLYGHQQIAPDIDREGLEWGDVERVQAVGGIGNQVAQAG